MLSSPKAKRAGSSTMNGKRHHIAGLLGAMHIVGFKADVLGYTSEHGTSLRPGPLCDRTSHSSLSSCDREVPCSIEETCLRPNFVAFVRQVVADTCLAPQSRGRPPTARRSCTTMAASHGRCASLMYCQVGTNQGSGHEVLSLRP